MTALTISSNATDRSLGQLCYRVDRNGGILDQHIWKGKPDTLLGFADASDVKTLQLTLDDVVRDGVGIIGSLIPVFSAADGDILTYSGIWSDVEYTLSQRADTEEESENK